MRRFISQPTSEQLPRRADVVILGGGPAGTAAAWALERAEPTLNIVVIEKAAQLGSGATLGSLENFRTCWAAPCLHHMMQRSIAVFHEPEVHFGEGVRLGVRQQGYLFLAFTPAQAAQLQADVAHLHACGLTHVRYLDTTVVQAEYPWLGERVLAAKHDPIAGWLDSHTLIYAFANATRRTQFLLDVADVRIQMADGRVTGVITPAGDIAAPAVVIAAGAGSRALGRTAGVDLPIVARPRQSFTTGWRHAAFPEDGPCVIAAYPFPHVRPEAGEGAIFGYEYRWTHKGGERQDALPLPDRPADSWKDPRFPSITLMLLARQFGHAPGEGFADPRYLRGLWHRAGYYVYRDNAYTIGADGASRPYDSQRAIIDAWPELAGLFVSVAHVGHGIMSAPAAGEILASRVLGSPLPDPHFADFGLGVPYVEHDAGGLSLPNH